ncbi:hypothetical protein BTR22_07400 [Alkalihalophilus pseudofirmus]|uniref:hypothetical protein n=1 Tax=Alkalihalophilus pseudofirmus TaxID=79885 RepID=UPI0009525BA3|nr:hypothetical protein BTR22_07400 [Alkalihalophilus pseudofirmus]
MKKKKQSISLGSYEFHCCHCDIVFEVEWEQIMELQELTHGFAGFHVNDVYIECPKCAKPAAECTFEEDDHFGPF